MRYLSNIIVFLISLLLASCSVTEKKEENKIGGFEFGMTQNQVDSVAAMLGLEKTNQMTERMAFKGILNLFGRNWTWLGLEFENDSLYRIEFQDWYSDSKLRDEVKNFNNSIKTSLNLSHKQQYGYPFIDIAISGNDKYISKIDKKNGTLSLMLFPSTPSTEADVIKQAISNHIDNSLNDLNKAMMNYLQTSNATIKGAYADDIKREVKFLNDHINDMSPRQLEWFQKLQNIKI